MTGPRNRETPDKAQMDESWQKALKRPALLAAALDAVETEREQVRRGWNGRSALSLKEAVVLADYVLELADWVQALGNKLEEMREQSCPGEWQGVYPGHCINPEECRGRTSCPRRQSCVE